MDTPYEIEDITGQEFCDVCRQASHTAAGLDGWLPSEFSLLSDEAFNKIATLLNAIENGAEWPRDLDAAKLGRLSIAAA